MCRSMGDVEKKAHIKKPKTKPNHTPVPAGYFPVYVGPNENGKQRFVVKAEMANHPLFGILLEEAESKYGVHRQGPISLPCDVDLFHKVLAEIAMELEDSKNHKSLDFKDDDNKNSYSLLHQSKLLKLNH